MEGAERNSEKNSCFKSTLYDYLETVEYVTVV